VDYKWYDDVPAWSLKYFIETIIKSKQHKRLLPPYREHLSQSFARYFMRVGLPVDIPREEIKNYA
jgi:hypothetical protein